jgi:hypothetical protein
LGQRYRVLQYFIDATPINFLSVYTSPVLRQEDGWRRCTRCGCELGLGKESGDELEPSRWAPFIDVLCASCRKSRNGEKVRPHCCLCYQPLYPVLPFDLFGQLRIVWCCPLHHLFVVGDLEGI